jgi:Rrf2 family iron-sulfur cluster assembly transcriptional regulator
VRLEVTRKSDLAVRVLRALADHPGVRMKASQLADIVGSTAGFVPQVVTPLVEAGWVHSVPGPTGGYALVADLADISILSVVEAIEGPTDSGRCVLANRPCGEEGNCALHLAWTRARAELLRELDAVSVAEASLAC